MPRKTGNISDPSQKDVIKNNIMGEFDFITRYFRPLSGAGAFSLRNDGAVLCPPEGSEIIISSDTMVENVHFLPDDPARLVARKLLRCNLSDLAAMGATPYGYSLNISIPKDGRYGKDWFAAFSEGLGEDQREFSFSLLGGDTTSINGPLVLGLGIYGLARKNCVLRRDTARPGDSVWVTGHLGCAALGLAVRQNRLNDHTGTLVAAYQCPTPRIGLALYGLVSSALDISDGILQDAGHLATESSVAITLYENLLPFSEAALAAGPQWRETRLLGGDDYELLITCPANNEVALQKEVRDKGVPVTRIGIVEEGSGTRMIGENGQILKFSRTGWQHF